MARLRSNLVTLQGSSSNTLDLVRIDSDDATPYTLVLQLKGTNTLFHCQALAIVTSVGANGANVVQQVVVTSVPQRLRFSASTVTVTVQAQVTNPSAPPSGTVQVSALAIPGDSNPLGDLFLNWVTSPTNAASGTIADTTAGNLLSVQGFLVAFGSGDSGPYYLQIHDLANAAALVSGTSVPKLELGPLTIVNGIGTAFSFDRSLRTSIQFGSGLVWALSTTPFVYTAPGAGAVARCDGDYGQ